MIPCFLFIFKFIIKVVTYNIQFYKTGDDEFEKGIGTRGNKVFW